MNFLKNFFDDESKIIGLCSFETMKPKYGTKAAMDDSFFNHFSMDNHFETKFEKNIFLGV